MHSSERPIISVIVCTYNRAVLLRGCLQSLADQTLDKTVYEVIVVNNNSADNTQGIAEEFAEKFPNFRVVKESQQGLSHARNRGYAEAEGDFVAYIDDDAKAAADWVEQMVAFIGRKPNVGAFGGPYNTFSMVPIPEWLPPEYARWSLGEEERPLRIGEEWLNGTNIVFRRQLFATSGGFNTGLGMAGDRLSYGEETRLLLDLAKKGVAVYYVPEMKVEHLIASYKMSLGWLLGSRYSAGRCSAEAFNYKSNFFSHMAGLCYSCLKAFADLLTPRRMPLKRRIYYSFSYLYHEIGALISYFKPAGGKQ